MKKLTMMMLFVIATVTCCMASTKTDSDAANYLSSVQTYLRSEGYMPKIDSDGDVEFKHDGDTYWVQAVPYDDGYYVTVMTITSVDGYSASLVRTAADETMRGLKYVRIYLSSKHDYVNVQVNWYCETMSDFKRMFDNALTVVSMADSRFISKILD